MMQPSLVRSSIRFLLSGLASRGADARSADASGPRRRQALEARGIEADPRRVRRFLEVTDGTRIAALASGTFLPPTYSALWESALALDLLARHGVRPTGGGLIHVSSELTILRPLNLQGPVRCRVELDEVREGRSGTYFTVAGRNWGPAGALRTETRTVLVARTPSKGRTKGRGKAEEVDEGWPTLAGWKLARGHGRRYARVSGDFNPIHLWGWSARMFGMRSPILHGFCLQAMVAHAALEHLGAGDPSSLRALEIHFRAPLTLPADVELRVGEPRADRHAFRVADGRGRLVADGGVVTA